VVTKSGDTNVADRCLELDEGVSLVVWVRWAGLAATTEVGVMADSALVAITSDVSLHTTAIGGAKRSITEDTGVTGLRGVLTTQGVEVTDRLVEWDKSVAGVNEAGVCNASRAVVPIWAVEALVADTIDVLVTTIADGIMGGVAARSKESLSQQAMVGFFGNEAEGMLRVMAVFHLYMALDAKVVIITSSASDKVILSQLRNAGIAGTGRYSNLLLFWSNKSSLGLGELWFWCNCLSCAVDNLAILHKTLDKPVVLATAEEPCINTCWAQIEVTTIASAAVIVFIWNSFVAVVAINGENAESGRWTACKFREPLIPS